jgi:iron complex transport system ATP-binding protein
LSVIKRIAQDKGKTFILSSHNPNHALYLDSNVYVLKDGRIENFGRAKDIINVDNLVKVYGDNICYSDELPYCEISFKDVTHV